MPEGRIVTPTSERKKPRFDKRDWSYIAEWIVEEKGRRKEKRKDVEKVWTEIDRQLRMEPSLKHKQDANGKEDKRKSWMSEMELPYQSQTLEVLTADARNMMFPSSGIWFRAHAEATDDYYDRVNFEDLILGSKNDVPSEMNQDNADKLVEGWLAHFHRQYDFRGHVDMINAEAFKYGLGVGCIRLVTKPILMDTARGVVSRKVSFPALVPLSIKDTYPDDSTHAVMHEGFFVGPGDIRCRIRKREDLVLAANRGSNEASDPNGGWMPSNLSRIEPDDKGNVEEIEFEGDLVVPRKSVNSIYIPGAIVTAVKGGGNEASATVVRFRWRKYPSYLWFPYHREDVDSPYASSPLMKGYHVQNAASQALNRFFDAAALRNGPPLGFEKNDPAFALRGPVVAPYELWETVDGITVHEIGDPAAMMAGFSDLSRQYYDVTGVNSPRMGAQTLSHTTAFAKDVEVQKGQTRTVDYVQSTLDGPLTRFLSLEYEMALDNMGKRRDAFFIDAYKGFVEVERRHLPDRAMFEAFGSGAPAEEQQRMANRLAAVQQAIQVEVLEMQMGRQPTDPLDLGAIKREILTEGGWSDVDQFIQQSESAPAGIAGPNGMDSASAGSPAIVTSPLSAE